MSASYLQGAMIFLRVINRGTDTAAADLLECRCANDSAAILCIQRLEI